MRMLAARGSLAVALALMLAARSASDVVIVGAVRDAGGAPLRDATVSSANLSTRTDGAGRYALRIAGLRVGQAIALRARLAGYRDESRSVRVGGDTVRADFTLARGDTSRVLAPAAVDAAAKQVQPRLAVGASEMYTRTIAAAAPAPGRADAARYETRPPLGDPTFGRPPVDREGYDRIDDNPFVAVAASPRSTFSVDVDRASYGNVRRFIAQGQQPPIDAVRIEELVNYFPYDVAAPRGDDPIAITTEVAPAPWQPRHRLVRIALRARPIETAALPPSQLVFLIDVSGSMNAPNKLPLVKRSLRLLVDELREQDRVAIVVYAGAAGVVLPSTSGAEKARIAEAIDRLEAGGSTAGGEGLLLAYRMAREGRIANGTNRIVLATDGDFNVGVSSDAELERLVEAKRSEGTYLTVLGFGTGNYQDAKMEKLAKRGNGNYAYVDELAEARKVLVHEMGATLHTVANDVKLQVEFNPAAVRGYRLIGYENRLLRDEDFADDAKDAGDVGAGHVVTALYEVVPSDVTGTVTLRGTDALRYGATTPSARGPADELLYVKLRYKRPGETASRLLAAPVRREERDRRPTADFRFAAAVAEFGMLLRDSEHKGSASVDATLALARESLGADVGGHRADFVRLVEAYRALPRATARR